MSTDAGDADGADGADGADQVLGGRGGDGHSARGALLKLAVIAPNHPSDPSQSGVAAHANTVAHLLAQAGHDVTLVSWSHPFPRLRSSARQADGDDPPEVAVFPRTVRALSWARPDTWVRTGRRLRGFDAIIVVLAMPIAVPAIVAVLRAAGSGGRLVDPSGQATPRSVVVVHSVLPLRSRAGERALIRSLFERVDAVLVHSPEQAQVALDLHAARVSVADPAGLGRLQQKSGAADLSSPWAHYVGAVEALASPSWHAADQTLPAAPLVPSLRERLAAPVARMVARRIVRRRVVLSMTRRDLPEWVRPSDVLVDRADADDARDWARSYGLPRCPDPITAWSALGALAAIVRLGDDGHRSAVIVDWSGPRSTLSRWARSIGFAPVALDFSSSGDSLNVLDVDIASLDVITRLHPHGCDAEDVDEALSQASWALRDRGLISLTLPLGPPSAEGAVGPADVRAILARAHDLGFALVGDADGEMAALMRGARAGQRRSDAAYALVRLTLRRR
jgi:hypothetical protein